VVIDEDQNRIEVVVPDEQLSLAIGRRGQNVRLASQLTGWDIDILTEEDESERRQKEFAERTNLFAAALDVDEVVAQLLASEGFASLEEIAYVELDEIAFIEGFDDDTATELQSRAKEYLDKREQELNNERVALGVEDALLQVPNMTIAMMVALGKDEMKTIDDFAGCVADDLLGWTERQDGEVKRFPGALEAFGLSREEADNMIMTARVQAGWITEEDLAGPAEEEAETDAEGTEETEGDNASA